MSEIFVVRTEFRGVARERIWDAARPIDFGYPSRFRLRRTESGASLDWSGANSIQLPPEVLRGRAIDLAGWGKLVVRPRRKLSPAYRVWPTTQAAASERQLFAYSGIRRSLIGCTAAHEAYVGYSRGVPVFTLEKSEGNYSLRALRKDLALKIKGRGEQRFAIGESVVVSAQQLSQARVIRGASWWRFNFLDTGQMTASAGRGGETSPADEPLTDRGFARFAGVLSLFVALAVGAIWLAGKLAPPAPTAESPAPEAVVKLRYEPQRVPVSRAQAPAALAASTSPPVPVPVPPVQDAAPKPMAPAPKTVPPVAQAPVARAASVSEEAKTAVPSGQAGPSQALFQALRAAKSASRIRIAGGIPAASPGAKTGHKGVSLGADSLGPDVKVRADSAAPTATVGTFSAKSGIDGAKAPESRAPRAGGSPGSSFVALAPEVSGVAGGLTKDEVGAVIHSKAAEVRFCHEAELSRNPTASGRLAVQFTVGSTGDVASAAVETADPGLGGIPDCLLARLKGWRFPRPKGGVSVGVKYPFLFRVLGAE